MNIHSRPVAWPKSKNIRSLHASPILPANSMNLQGTNQAWVTNFEGCRLQSRGRLKVSLQYWKMQNLLVLTTWGEAVVGQSLVTDFHPSNTSLIATMPPRSTKTGFTPEPFCESLMMICRKWRNHQNCSKSVDCMGPTVEHILISCIDFDIIRHNFYTASNLKDLFHNIHPKELFCFIHSNSLTNIL